MTRVFIKTMSLRKKRLGNKQKEHTTMMRLIKTTGWLAMAAAIIFGTAACSDDDDSIAEQQPANPTEPQVYTMTIEATKSTGDAVTTRALSLDGKTLHATWTDGEKVGVYEGITRLGTLVATNSNGATCTLSGTLDKAPSASGITLTLEFNGIVQNYQYGTLDYIATHCDHAIATTVVTVNGATITGTDAIFENQQAIVKFKITDKGGNALNASNLVLDIDLNDAMKTELSSHLTETQMSGLQDTYQINPSNATYETNGGTGILFLAISYPPKDLTSINNYLANQNISITIGPDDFKLVLTVTVGDDTYTLTKSGFPFTNGKYYEITVSMTKQTENVVNMKDVGYLVDNPSLAYTARTGDVLTGQAVKDLDNEYTDRIAINIADGATVTLRNVTIDGSGYSEGHAGITCSGDATIILEGTNTITSFDVNYPGIYVPSGKTLTIQGSGSLTASGGAAGIGGCYNSNCGNINITGGTIVAIGGNSSAGIGSGMWSTADSRTTCGNINISGSSTSVTATGDGGAAGIGSGNGAACGNISITGGTVVATGGERAAGIGGGCFATCGNITIAGTVTSVTATKGNMPYSSYSDPYSIGVGMDYGDYRDTPTEPTTDCGTITFDTVAITPTWQKGDEDHKNAWIYTPTPTDGQTYGGLTLAIAGNTWTLTPVTP